MVKTEPQEHHLEKPAMSKKEHTPTILLVSSYNKANGTGHLRRTLSLLETFGEQAVLYVPDDAILAMAEKLGTRLSEKQICRAPQQDYQWQLIVLDNYKTTMEQARFFMSLGRVVALDEGGEARRVIPYLIDLLPSLPEMGVPNEQNAGYLNLPERSGSRAFPPRRILVTFGGTDEAHLTEVMGQLLESYDLKTVRWDVVKGPLFNRTFAWPGVKILEVSDVKAILPEYDLVFTHFGLTAYEAAASGAFPFLLNPTPYHEKLAKLAGFPTLGVEKVNKTTEAKLYDFLLGKGQGFDANVRLGEKQSLAHRLDELLGEIGGCPSCVGEEGRFGPVLYRDYRKSYARCPLCGLVYQEQFYEDETVYNANYFFDDYKKQYGKTYLEDFDHIKEMAAPRLKKITSKLKTGSKKLLDIGCAYGAFLKAAEEAGYDVTGLDASEEAVNYVNKQLNIKAHVALLPVQKWPADQLFDVISMWYVIEHFKELNKVMLQLTDKLSTGGILAFSTPKGDGMTAGSNPDQFYRESPNDHYIIFDKKNIRRFLERYGYRLVSVRTTGVHPERRYPTIDRNGFKYKILCHLYTWLGKGDTFEVYAQKVN